VQPMLTKSNVGTETPELDDQLRSAHVPSFSTDRLTRRLSQRRRSNGRRSSQAFAIHDVRVALSLSLSTPLIDFRRRSASDDASKLTARTNTDRRGRNGPYSAVYKPD